MDPMTDTHELAASLRFSVTRLARLLRQQSDVGLTPTQLAALATIDRSGPLPIGTLADEEQIGPPTATKIVDKLHAAGYVERQADPHDRRVTLVAASAEGRALLAAIRERKDAWLTRRLENLSPAELADLAGAVEVLQALTLPRKPPTPAHAAVTSTP